ncbi:hypothetical protein BD324DRAFT_623778 [Kockovaella imperatae]|uniref:Uncharacterized protein n=1 Tax=Kockovaella imperatae TaxID=4999 RepID=A0A1Y1UIM6_9TREE|nr:hypothetical protein BD324DRAFT_623778 [Kockovaella imperatae]ORX37913.1 hypothetical protein BD324DRAFT_623778 [Kockovaella imperatae]
MRISSGRLRTHAYGTYINRETRSHPLFQSPSFSQKTSNMTSATTSHGKWTVNAQQLVTSSADIEHRAWSVGQQEPQTETFDLDSGSQAKGESLGLQKKGNTIWREAGTFGMSLSGFALEDDIEQGARKAWALVRIPPVDPDNLAEEGTIDTAQLTLFFGTPKDGGRFLQDSNARISSRSLYSISLGNRNGEDPELIKFNLGIQSSLMKDGQQTVAAEYYPGLHMFQLASASASDGLSHIRAVYVRPRLGSGADNRIRVLQYAEDGSTTGSWLNVGQIHRNNPTQPVDTETEADTQPEATSRVFVDFKLEYSVSPPEDRSKDEDSPGPYNTHGGNLSDLLESLSIITAH